jgi:hypothetical protein
VISHAALPLPVYDISGRVVALAWPLAEWLAAEGRPEQDAELMRGGGAKGQ